MRILVNPRPSVLSSQPLPAGWHVIQQPKPALGLGISILTGLGLPFVPLLLLSLESWLLPRVAANQTETIPWWILLPVLLVSVVAHEFLHLLWHPGWGLSSQSLMLIWSRRLLVGVYYEGFMPRTRWLVMRLSPLVGLTVLPTLVLLVVYPYGMSFFWQQFIMLVILVNSLGAGGDLVASVIVAQQVASGGQVGNWNGRACWRAEKAIGSESRFSRSGCLYAIRLFVPAAIAFVVGSILYTWRPLWLAPPYHAYSPVLYFLLALGWIPFCAYGVWRLPKHRLLVTVLGILLIQLMCAAVFVASPHAYYELVHMRGEDHGSLEYGSLDEQHCFLQDQIFTCELAIGSSDNDMVILYTYRFEVINDLPVMWLTSFSSRLDCNPAYLSCSRSSPP